MCAWGSGSLLADGCTFGAASTWYDVDVGTGAARTLRNCEFARTDTVMVRISGPVGANADVLTTCAEGACPGGYNCTGKANSGTEWGVTCTLNTTAPWMSLLTGDSCANTEDSDAPEGKHPAACSASSDFLLTIQGHNFGSDSANVTVGGVECTDVQHDAWLPTERITCTVAARVGADREVVVTNTENGESSTANAAIDRYLPAYVSAQEPVAQSVALPAERASLPTAGNVLITISCLHIGPELDPRTPVTVTVDDQDCPDAQWVDTATVTCLAPAWAGKDLAVRITAGGQTSTADTANGAPTVSYSAPSINSLLAPTESGQRMCILGDEMGGDSDVDLQVGACACLQAAGDRGSRGCAHRGAIRRCGHASPRGCGACLCQSSLSAAIRATPPNPVRTGAV